MNDLVDHQHDPTLSPVLAQSDQLAQTNPAVAYLISLSSKRSRQTMASLLTLVAKMLGYADLVSCQWQALRRQHVQALLQMLADSGKAPATINTYLSAIKGTVQEAWLMELMSTDDYQHIRHVRSVKGSRLEKGRALSSREIKKLLTCCWQEQSCKGIRDAAIISTLVGCGLRRAEIVSLDVEQFDEEGLLRVLGKGNKERLAFLPEPTLNAIQQWLAEVRGTYDGPLFTRIRRFDDVTDERLSDQAIYHILETRRRQCGIKKFAPHDLRRTFASMMLANGEDIVTVKDAMGHASITTTQKYDRRGEQRLKSASQRIHF